MQRNQIKQEAVEALKSGDSKKANSLRYLVSLIEKRELQLPLGEFDESEETKVLQKELKNKEEAKEMFIKGGRADLVAEQEAEIEWLKKYLPKDMSEVEIKEIVKKIVSQKGNNFGIIMGEVMREIAGRAGGEIVFKIVKEELGQ
ncbi:MAG: GatB/YqeY domain-containing protein [Candidatus Shapirobacteria bacterium]